MPDLNDLQRASTEQLLDRHIGEPLRQINAELLKEVADRIRAVLADCDSVDLAAQPVVTHDPDCWQWHAGCLAARIRATLTGEDLS